ncbi:hypothetical protein ACFORO_12455 [Amycolatopsis halotolerans]|uniref:Uncharacterized protein n=1 Tax=Amycolatopsis halotolerans TaxID=330083 RepID=A0ABV7QFG0_9PSEU
MTANLTAEAAKLLQHGTAKGLDTDEIIEVVRTISGLNGEDADVNPGPARSFANIAGATLSAGTDPRQLIAAIEETAK